LWAMGEESAADRIRGKAGDFCRVAVRRRHWKDMNLEIEGDEAKRFVEIVQAYAGPPGPGRKSKKEWKANSLAAAVLQNNPCFLALPVLFSLIILAFSLSIAEELMKKFPNPVIAI
jgi:hypothetical protein